MKSRGCELCSEEASLYCESDSAFLCWNCDSKVHGANFLVARHIRRTICSKCNGFDGNCMSGIKLRPFKPICLSCSSDSDEENRDLNSLSSASSSSSDCLSTAESFNTCSVPKRKEKINFDRNKRMKISSSSSVTDVSGEETSLPGDFSSFPVSFTGEESSMKTERTRRVRDLTNVDSKAEVILVNWCNKLGLKSNSTLLSLASQALRVCLQKLTFLPFRVALASSFWFSMKFLNGTSSSTCQNLKRLEEISGVPVKLIVLAESKISRVLNLNRRSKLDLEESWAEC